MLFDCEMLFTVGSLNKRPYKYTQDQISTHALNQGITVLLSSVLC